MREALAQRCNASGSGWRSSSRASSSRRSKARRFADPASPYFDHLRRLLLLYQKQMPHAAQPADAARVIYEAATSPEPRLRWLVGEDARLLVAGGPAMPDDQYLEEIRQRFGFTW